MYGSSDRNSERFSGFALLYDASRPAPPAALGPLLASYADVVEPVVVDIGSGTGLSSRWAAAWARSVTGIEPNRDMRERAESMPTAGVTYRSGFGHRTGLERACADVVLAVQAMHWMEPDRTLTEVARILRPEGVFAVIDADWPPVVGIVGAERAWISLHRRIRVLEARAARGESEESLRRAIPDDDDSLLEDDLADPHKNRAIPAGVRSWPKSEHLRNITASGYFPFARELLFDEEVQSGAAEFVALMSSQGSYQGLLRLGLTDEEIGVGDFERDVYEAFSARESCRMRLSWRVRIGVRALSD